MTPAPPGPFEYGQGSGRDVYATLGGKIGNTTWGCSPAMAYKRVVILVLFLLQEALKLAWPHNGHGLAETPRLTGVEVWRCQCILRRVGTLNTYASLAILVTWKRPLSVGGRMSAPGFCTTSQGHTRRTHLEPRLLAANPGGRPRSPCAVGQARL